MIYYKHFLFIKTLYFIMILNIKICIIWIITFYLFWVQTTEIAVNYLIFFISIRWNILFILLFHILIIILFLFIIINIYINIFFIITIWWINILHLHNLYWIRLIFFLFFKSWITFCAFGFWWRTLARWIFYNIIFFLLFYHII